MIKEKTSLVFFVLTHTNYLFQIWQHFILSFLFSSLCTTLFLGCLLSLIGSLLPARLSLSLSLLCGNPCCYSHFCSLCGNPFSHFCSLLFIFFSMHNSLSWLSSFSKRLPFGCSLSLSLV